MGRKNPSRETVKSVSWDGFYSSTIWPHEFINAQQPHLYMIYFFNLNYSYCKINDKLLVINACD